MSQEGRPTSPSGNGGYTYGIRDYLSAEFAAIRAEIWLLRRDVSEVRGLLDGPEGLIPWRAAHIERHRGRPGPWKRIGGAAAALLLALAGWISTWPRPDGHP